MKIIATDRYATIDGEYYVSSVPVVSEKDYWNLSNEFSDLNRWQYRLYVQLCTPKILGMGNDGYMVATLDWDTIPKWRHDELKKDINSLAAKEQKFYDKFKEAFGDDKLDELLRNFRPDDTFHDEIRTDANLKQHQINHKLWCDGFGVVQGFYRASLLVSLLGAINWFFFDGTWGLALGLLLLVIASSLKPYIANHRDQLYDLLVTAVKQAYPQKRFTQHLDKWLMQPLVRLRDLREKKRIVPEYYISPDYLYDLAKPSHFIVDPHQSFLIGRRLNDDEVEVQVFHLLPRTPLTNLEKRRERIMDRLRCMYEKRDGMFVMGLPSC